MFFTWNRLGIDGSSESMPGLVPSHTLVALAERMADGVRAPGSVLILYYLKTPISKSFVKPQTLNPIKPKP